MPLDLDRQPFQTSLMMYPLTLVGSLCAQSVLSIYGGALEPFLPQRGSLSVVHLTLLFHFPPNPPTPPTYTHSALVRREKNGSFCFTSLQLEDDKWEFYGFCRLSALKPALSTQTFPFLLSTHRL